MSSITEKARAKAAEVYTGLGSEDEHLAAVECFAEGYAARAAEELSDKQVAQIIDQHRQIGRWVGDGVTLVCTCGHESRGEHPDVPQDAENNAHRSADRGHAAHVAAQLRAARDTGEQA